MIVHGRHSFSSPLFSRVALVLSPDLSSFIVHSSPTLQSCFFKYFSQSPLLLATTPSLHLKAPNASAPPYYRENIQWSPCQLLCLLVYYLLRSFRVLLAPVTRDALIDLNSSANSLRFYTYSLIMSDYSVIHFHDNSRHFHTCGALIGLTILHNARHQHPWVKLFQCVTQ